MQPLSQKETLFKGVVIFSDLIFLLLALTVLSLTSVFERLNAVDLEIVSLVYVCSFLLSVVLLPPVAHMRAARSEVVVGKAFQTTLSIMVLFLLALFYFGGLKFRVGFLFMLFFATFTALFVSRLLCREAFKVLRRVGRDNRNVVLVGTSLNLVELFEGMCSDPTTGYRLIGYFNDIESLNFGGNLPYLGTINDILSYLESNQVDQLYCALPSARADEIRLIINYCENHLVRFYSVPNVRNYLHRQMSLDFVNDVPVLSIREEPLREPLNRFVKRSFDILVSLTFLCTLFIPICLVVGIIIKISSPGPIFFRQKRNGLNNKEFTCYKFRSMHVNDMADELQATENDPRKFKFGDFMRRMNIDELPQFFNVLIGDMSLVGPRPHMLKHTEEYSALINRYMVRHFAKPGITGWAQVRGLRGETKELWQMEERIKRDIWYVENWTFWLDMRILYLTVKNMLLHDKNAY